MKSVLVSLWAEGIGDIVLELSFMVREYPDVFLNELPSLPTDKEVDFAINLLQGTSPIFSPSYRMAPTELVELQRQLHELKDLGFIHHSMSPWRAYVLFAKKKDGTF